MGFPSPAADYVESRLSLDEALIQKPAATYYMRAGETIYRCGIMKDALLVIDSSLKPCDGSLLICDCNGEFKVKRGTGARPDRVVAILLAGRASSLAVGAPLSRDLAAVLQPL